MRVERSKDCGNSPKNKFAEDIAIAIITGDAEAVDGRLADGFECEIVGGSGPCAGLGEGAFGKAAIKGLSVKTVVTHGRAGAVDGVVKLNGGADRGFCMTFRFASAKADKISQVKLYMP